MPASACLCFIVWEGRRVNLCVCVEAGTCIWESAREPQAPHLSGFEWQFICATGCLCY